MESKQKLICKSIYLGIPDFWQRSQNYEIDKKEESLINDVGLMMSTVRRMQIKPETMNVI